MIGARQKKFSDCVSLLSGGTPAKSNPQFWGGQIPWVSCKDMKVDRIAGSQDYLTEDGAAKIRMVPERTILLVVRGMILAKALPVALTNLPVTFNQDLKALICKEGIDTTFLYYWLKGNEHQILGIVDEAGHGTKRIQTDRLMNLNVTVPELPTQRRIASILSAYDDLIENNNKRIKILEEMARMLYREWFVHFRFPGHEKVKMVDSALGKIPEGWRAGTLFDLPISFIDGDRGKNYPKKADFLERGFCLFLNTGNIKQDRFDFSTTAFITEERDNLLRKGKLSSGDTILTTRGTVGSVAYYSDIPAYKYVRINSGMLIVRTDDHLNAPLFFYHLFKSQEMKENYTQFATGSAQPQLPIKTLEKIPIIIPAEHLMTLFNEQIYPTNRMIELLQLKNMNLQESRDLLLPKLISGELDVDELDIEGAA